MPDTGQTTSYTDTFGEDSDYLINPPSYTKLDADGNELADDAVSWTMVRDNVTGLIWEVKTDDESVHDKDNQYTWYNSNSDTNGGDAGTPGDGTDTEDFINELNSSNYGGHSDWRLPTRAELLSIADYGTNNPAIDIDYFPVVMMIYNGCWSSITGAINSGSAWYVSLGLGNASLSDKSYGISVRAVRGGQSGSFNNLVISEPVQGAMYKIGNNQDIAWETKEIAGSVKISLSYEGGKDGTFETIVESTENDGIYAWIVTGPESVNCVLKIEPLNDTSRGMRQATGKPTPQLQSGRWTPPNPWLPVSRTMLSSRRARPGPGMPRMQVL